MFYHDNIVQEQEGEKNIRLLEKPFAEQDGGSENKAVWQEAGSSSESGHLLGTRAGNQPHAATQQGPGNEISESQEVVGS